MYFNEKMETLPREALKQLQSQRLVETVKRVYDNVPAYRKKMEEKGLTPEDIHGVDDLSKLPFTTYIDLREAYPFGMAAAPKSEWVRLHASSGTTGKSKIAVYTKHDIDVWSEVVARCLAMAGLTKDDVLLVGYGYGLFTGGLGAHYGGEKLGALVLPVSTGNTQKTIDMLIDCQATAIACTPSYLLHIAEALEREGLMDKIALKYAICGAEPWTDEMRARLEAKLNIHCYDIYGLTEIIGPGVANDCPAHAGLHIWEDHFLPEIIDPVTGEVLPEGSEGELVITTLTKEGMPMIRYRTKDLTSLAYETCTCGRTCARIQRFKGRSDDMLIIKGVNVFPSQVEAALLTIDGMTPNYFITVDRVNDQDVMEVAVELDEHFFSDEIADLERLTEKVKHVLKTAIGLNVQVRLVEPNTLEHSQGKTKHVLDKRKLY